MTKNRTLRNGIIFTIIFTIFFGIDLLLKTFVFDSSNADLGVGQPIYDYKVIGIRSLKHPSTTFLDFLHLSIDNWIIITISLSIGFVILILVVFAKSKISVIGLSLIMAGLLGNTLDNIRFEYVRDMLFTPWMDKGTFNFADVILIVGLPFALIPMLFNLYKEK